MIYNVEKCVHIFIDEYFDDKIICATFAFVSGPEKACRPSGKREFGENPKLSP